MVEGDDRGVEADREVVGEAGPPGRRHHPFQARAEIVGEIADRAALERRAGRDRPRSGRGRQHRPQGLEGGPGTAAPFQVARPSRARKVPNGAAAR